MVARPSWRACVVLHTEKRCLSPRSAAGPVVRTGIPRATRSSTYGTDSGSAAAVPDLSAASAAITLEVAPVQTQTLADAPAAAEPARGDRCPDPDTPTRPPSRLTVPQQAERTRTPR